MQLVSSNFNKRTWSLILVTQCDQIWHIFSIFAIYPIWHCYFIEQIFVVVNVLVLKKPPGHLVWLQVPSLQLSNGMQLEKMYVRCTNGDKMVHVCKEKLIC